ncbi:uncharacterized protein LOC135816082 [Sycon ciliatum]|uniref:uncharacterized protein LOC135816082 n=1 Tax=Sycon ciliatum TaxID=27933 RepID=UPI0020A9213B|eukprot:scpid66783/ scgid20165/ UDP-GlcNAc:betaGal beta-1,3-N-acetylglucosaminyltransferase 6; Core 3 synthase
MFPRPDTPGSWKFIRRKVAVTRSPSLFFYIFLLGFGVGLIYFSSSSTSTKAVELETTENGKQTSTAVTTPVGTTVLSSSRATVVTPRRLNMRPTRPPIVLNGVQHPHTQAASAWLDIARNTSGLREDVHPDAGGKQRVTLFVLVKSAPAYKERRALCRTHWQWRSAEKKTFIPGLVAQQFLIGHSGKADVDQAVVKEAVEFEDILQYPDNDTYRRLPWKVLWGMKYVSEHYKFDMLLLMDDDSFVNYPMALRWTASQLAEHIYAGQLVDMHPKVQRNKKDQWYVPPSVYAPDEYPPYHWGAGYFLSADLVTAIVRESTHHEILWIDDAFMAILLNATGLHINLQDIRVYAVPDWAIFLCCEPSPLVLGSRNAKKMARVGTYQQSMNALCRFRRSKHCKRPKSI